MTAGTFWLYVVLGTIREKVGVSSHIPASCSGNDILNETYPKKGTSCPPAPTFFNVSTGCVYHSLLGADHKNLSRW